MSRRGIVGIVVGVALVALLVAGRLLLPGFARDALVAAIGDATGREASAQDLSLELLAGRAQLTGFSLAGEGSPLVALESLAVDLAWLDLFEKRVRVESLVAKGLALRVSEAEPFVVASAQTSDDAAVPGGSEGVGTESGQPAAEEGGPRADEAGGWPILLEAIALEDLRGRVGDGPEAVAFELPTASLASLRIEAEALVIGALALEAPRVRLPQTPQTATDAPQGESDAPAAPFRFGALVDGLPGARVAGLSLRDGALSLERAGGSFDVGLDLAVDEVVLARGGETHLELDTRLGEGRLTLAGDLALDPLHFAGTLVWSDVELARLQPFVSGLALDAGKSSAQLRVEFGVEEAAGQEELQAGLGGELAILEARASNPSQGVLGWDALRLAIRDVRWVQPSAGAPRVQVELEEIRLAGPDLEWSTAQAPPSETELESEPEPERTDGTEDELLAVAPDIRIDRVEIAEGRVFARDPGVSPALEARARFEGSAQAIRWPPGDVGLLSLSVIGEQGEALSVSGTLEQGKGRIEVDLDSLALQRFDGYASDLAGVGIEQGSLSWEGGVDVAEGRARVAGKLVLADLDLENRKEGALESLLGTQLVGVPYDVALPMLRGQDGLISLPLAIEVADGRTRLNLVKILRDALQQAVIAALSTPLATVNLLGALVFDDGDVPLPPIAFAPGSATPSGAAKERLGAVAELLAARDDVVARIDGRSGPADRAHLERRDAEPAEPGDPRDPAAALARERARACAQFLHEQLGVARVRIQVGAAQKGPPGVAVVLRQRGKG